MATAIEQQDVGRWAAQQGLAAVTTRAAQGDDAMRGLSAWRDYAGYVSVEISHPLHGVNGKGINTCCYTG